MENLKKISDTSIEIETTTKRVITLDQLLAQKKMWEAQQANITTQLAKVDDKIAQVKALGVITQVEKSLKVAVDLATIK